MRLRLLPTRAGLAGLGRCPANMPEEEIKTSGIAESLDILLDHCEEASNWKVPSYFGIDAHRKLVLDSDKCNRHDAS